MFKLLAKFKAVIVLSLIIFIIFFIFHKKKNVSQDERIILEVTDVVSEAISV